MQIEMNCYRQEAKLEPVVSSKKSISGLYDELNSFYSDIATIEATHPQSSDKSDASVLTYSTVPEQPPPETPVIASKHEEKGTKKKKKVSVLFNDTINSNNYK